MIAAAAARGEATDKDKASDEDKALPAEIEARLASFEAQLAALNATMLAVHDGIRGVGERTLTIEQSIARRKARTAKLKAGASSADLKGIPPHRLGTNGRAVSSAAALTRAASTATCTPPGKDDAYQDDANQDSDLGA